MALIPLVLGILWFGLCEWVRGRPRLAQHGTLYIAMVGWCGLAVGLGSAIAVVLRPN